MAVMAALERAVVIVLDGVGVGQAPDAASYGDEGANCLTNCAEAVGGLSLPAMGRMGIGNVTPIRGVSPAADATGAYGRLIERAAGKDSTTGHWELIGVILERPLPTYPHGFPPDLVARFEAAIGRPTLAINPPLAPKSSPSWATNTCAPASRSSTPRPIASSSLPRMRKSSHSTSCTRCAARRARC